MDNYFENLDLRADDIDSAKWIYGPNGKKYIKYNISFKNASRHVLTTCYFYPKKPYGSYLCMCMSEDICQKIFQSIQRYKNRGYKEMFPYLQNSWPRLTRAVKNGWDKRPYDVCSLNKIHDFENSSRPFAWAFCKSLSFMPTLEFFEDGPLNDSDGEEIMNAMESMLEELGVIYKELQTDLSFKDKAMIELIRARNGLVAGVFLGALRSVIRDLPDVTSALLENDPSEIITFID